MRGTFADTFCTAVINLLIIKQKVIRGYLVEDKERIVGKEGNLVFSSTFIPGSYFRQ